MTKHFWRPLLIASLLSTAGALAVAGDKEKAGRFYEDALARYERKDIAGAIIQLKNALQQDRTLLPVQVLLGKALLANGEANNAEVALNEALRLGVSKAEVIVPLTQAMMLQGKQGFVIEQTRSGLAGLPANIQFQLLLLRASSQSDTGDTAGALRSLLEARQLEPGSPDSWNAEVPVRIRGRQLKEAIAAADKAIALAPDAAEGHYQRATITHLQSDPITAIAAYEKPLKLNPGHVEARLARAGLYIDMRKFKEAGADVDELLRLVPEEPRAVYLYALLAEQNGNTTEAKDALHAVTGLIDPAPIDFIRFRPQLLLVNGLAHFGLNEMAKAKPYLEFFQKVQGNTPVTKLLAQIYLAEPSIDRAIELLDGYARQYPGDGQALTLLASAHMAQGRHARASALMQEALRSRDSAEFRTVLGMSLMRGGQPGNALVELEKVYAKDPRQLQAGTALVGLYLRDGRVGRAQQTIESLIKHLPPSASLFNLQGIVRLQARDPVGAKAAYEKALQLDAKLAQAKLGLARVEILARAFDAAQRRLEAILREDERNIEALFEMAVLAEQRGAHEDAQKWLEKAVDHSGPRELRPGIALVGLHMSRNRTPQALEAAKQLLAKAPEDVQVLTLYARAQIANGDAAGARSTLTLAARRAGFEAPVLVDIAGHQQSVGDLAGAAYSLDKALSGQADYLPALIMMTTVELKQNDPVRAEKRARHIMQLQPKQAVGYGLLADVALARQQNEVALDALRQAHQVQPSTNTLRRLVQLQGALGNDKAALALAEQWLKANPKDVVILREVGDALARQGQYAAARSRYQAILALTPGDIEILNNLANALMALQDPGAVNVAEQALARAPGNPLITDTAGWANHLAGRNDRALQLLREARLRAPGQPEIRYHLAVALAKAGRKTEAREELQAALGTSTTFTGANDAKNLLSSLK